MIIKLSKIYFSFSTVYHFIITFTHPYVIHTAIIAVQKVNVASFIFAQIISAQLDRRRSVHFKIRQYNEQDMFAQRSFRLCLFFACVSVCVLCFCDLAQFIIYIFFHITQSEMKSYGCGGIVHYDGTRHMSRTFYSPYSIHKPWMHRNT